ncbi:hypothetical protein OROGR_015263 [Orobanche gracilis]
MPASQRDDTRHSCPTLFYPKFSFSIIHTIHSASVIQSTTAVIAPPQPPQSQSQSQLYLVQPIITCLFVRKYQLLNPCKSSGAERVKLKLTIDYPQPRKDLLSEDTYCKKKIKTSRLPITGALSPLCPSRTFTIFPNGKVRKLNKTSVKSLIKSGWLKWKNATGFLCDPDIPNRLKGKFYRTAIRPTLLYGTECWAVKQCHVHKMSVAEMRMLRWMCGHTRKDRVAPVVPGSVLQTLLNLGITETDESELRTLTIGYNEIKLQNHLRYFLLKNITKHPLEGEIYIVDLLKGSLISNTPLTDLIFPERGKMDFVIKKLLPKVSKESSSSSSSKMTVKAMIQKSTNMILFVEAKEDFVGFLFSFFFIPLGAVGCLLGGNTSLDNIDSLSRSITNLDGNEYLTKDTKAVLLKPQISEIYNNYDHFFPFAEKGLSTSKSARTYVLREQILYNVADDLTVTPFCMTSSYSFLSRLKIPLSDIDEVDLEIGLDEGLRILKASLTSTTALTDGLMNSIAKKQPKQEC